MLQDQSIICFAPSDWWGMNPSCTSHLMQSFASKNKVLYINPFSSDLLAGGSKKGIGVRIIRKLKSIFKCLRQVEKNLYVFSPVFLPLQGRRIIDVINNIALRWQIKLLCRWIGISQPVLWMENVRAADMLDWFKPKIILYHVSDLFGDCSYISNRQLQRQREEKISQRSDILICVSERLYEIKAAQRDNVFYLPHGVDFDLFRRESEQRDFIERLTESILGKKATHPIAGYFGTMTQHNDIELLLHCARKLPDVSFVLAGQITSGDYSKLGQLPNVFLLGRLPYEQIPKLCAGFDVCMLQWKMGEWIRCCNPLKLLEYMASGRPTVSVAIDEVIEKYSELVSVAHSKEEFCDAIRWELENDNEDRIQKRIEIAHQHSWDSHVEKISQMIEETVFVSENTVQSICQATS